MKKLLYLTAVAALLFSGCKNDPPDYTGFEGAATLNSENYQPVSKGTYWKFASSGTGQDPDSSLTTMQGTAAVFNGKIYQSATTKAKSDATPGSVYFLHEGNSYYEKEVTNGDTTDVLYLKTGVGLGGTWDALYGSAGADSKSTGKLLEKDISRTVFNKTYNDVMHTSVTVQSNDGTGNPVTVLVIDFYIAKGVGIIETNANLLGTIVSSRLYEYSVK